MANTEQLLKEYTSIKAQIKNLEAQVEEKKALILEQVKENTVVQGSDADYKVQIRKIKKIKFANTVDNDRIIGILKTRPEIAIEYAVALKNMGAGLASKLDIIMENEETVVEETVYPMVQALVKTTTTTQSTQPAATSNDDCPF